MIYYCEADGLGPAPLIDWNARIAAANAIPDDGVFFYSSVDEAMTDFMAGIPSRAGTTVTITRDTAIEAIAKERNELRSHVVRNGSLPRIGKPGSHIAASLSAPLTLTGEADGFGGTRVTQDGELLRCPECLAPIRMVL